MTQPLNAATGNSRKNQNHWVMKSMSPIAVVGGGGRMSHTLVPEVLPQRQQLRRGEHPPTWDGPRELCDQQRHAERALHGGNTEVQRNRLRVERTDDDGGSDAQQGNEEPDHSHGAWAR